MTEEVKLRPEEEERLRRLLVRSDPLADAYTLVHDAGWEDTERKARTLTVLEELGADANEAVERYKRELGLS